MDLSGLQVLIGDLCNDPNHDRYFTSQIGTELDNEQRKWNVEAKIIKDTATITSATNTRQYALSNLTGTPISFPRTTFDGIELKKVDKSWIDLYTQRDWTADQGTPTRFLIETTDPDVQYLTVYPTPLAADANKNIVVEYVKDHTTLSASTDEPFNSSDLVVPYHWGLAYGVSSRLLVRDPSTENALKVQAYAKIASGVLQDVIQVFKALEREEPLRLRASRRPIRGIYA